MYEPPRLHSGLRRTLETRAITFSLEALQRRRARFHLAVLSLARTGIIVVRGAASEQAVAALATMAKTTWDEAMAAPAGASMANAILNRGEERFVKGYKALVESKQPVINFRHGQDDGMMDIFHPEEMIAEQRDVILSSLHESLVKDIAERAFGKSLEVTCRNLYVNHGVQDTRFYHCDGERVKVKTFVYACDVDCLAIGPYCYVKSSHRKKALRQRNQAFNAKHDLNKHEYRLMGDQAGLPVFCRAGDMVISAQHGAHRGYPQAPSATRAVLVNVFEPIRSGSKIQDTE